MDDNSIRIFSTWKQNKGKGSSLDLWDKIRLSVPKTLDNFHNASVCIWTSKNKAVMFETKNEHFPLPLIKLCELAHSCQESCTCLHQRLHDVTSI